MAYTPKTWTTGETITAAELNTIEQAASTIAAAADTANAGLAGKVNSSTYTAGLASKAPLLTPTATKTGAYTAAVGDLAVMNVAGGATALSLPTAPADKSVVGFLAVGATAATPLTVNRGGADTIGASAATTITAPLSNEVTVYQYDAPNTRWLPVANVKPLASLDTRYPSRSDVTTQLATVSNVPVFRPIGSGAQPPSSTSPTTTGTLAGGTSVKRIVPAVTVQSMVVKWGNFEVGGQESHTTTTTLSAAATAGATTLTTVASVPAGVTIVLDTGTVAEPVQTTAVSGAGPFTVTLAAATKNAHSTGSAVSIMYGDMTIVAAGLEYPSGTVTPLAFNGNSGTVMKAGGIATCDEIAMTIPAGSPFWIRTYVTWTAGTFVPLQGIPIVNGQSNSLSATPSDKTWQTGSNVGGDTIGPSPIAVLGRVAPTVNAIALVGDSIANGTGDYPDQARGYTGIATDGVVPAQKVTSPTGRAMYDAVPAGRWRKWRLIPGCTSAYEAYGINDITAGSQSLAQLQASKITLWSALRAIPGIRNIYTATLVPFTSSTDGFTTATNQTPSGTFETIRVGLNDWIRDGAPVVSAANLTAVATGTAGALRAGGSGHPINGYVELADTVEVNAANTFTRNGGRWNSPTGRTVTDAAMTSGTKVVTSATAAFTSADLGLVVAVAGAGPAGGYFVGTITTVTNATTVTLGVASGANATATVSGATAKIGGWTQDGTHPSTPAHTAMAAAFTAALPALTA